MASAPGAAVSVPIKIKFIFANHDGVVVEYTAEPGTLVKDLKTELADQWPSAVEPVTDMSHVRLICMGIGILSDTKSLAECRIPHFDSHPTPVNVSIRPKDVRLPQSDAAQAAKAGAAGGGGVPNRGCCTVS